MKKLIIPILALSFSITSCYKTSPDVLDSESQDAGGSEAGEAGILTAAEWNDLENWSFWNNLMNSNTNLKNTSSEWSFYTNNRISVIVQDNDRNPMANATVSLKKDGSLVFETISDNRGSAELWIGLTDENLNVNPEDYTLYVNGVEAFRGFTSSTNYLIATEINDFDNEAQVAFIVDATGSMSDELNFLKLDLEDVINKVGIKNPNITIQTGSVFYRDQGDDYLTKLSSFTTNIASTIKFIEDQKAGGGGDTPEAVHSALEEALSKLAWNEHAKTRLAFLMLDAPPHHKREVIESLKKSINEAAKRGIKLIPIAASGVDKETEFLMRHFAIATNGTYVFITNDSGIGSDHIQATVGDYDVEYLNDLLVRLIHENTN
ncbi:MAG: VWA domain-containing protein [Salibacteraceae bacterium]|nr:VWA domain-containing protein [Salibacteraceae bacterium]